MDHRRVREYDDLAYQDQVESQAIFNLLEQEVVPLYFFSVERPFASPVDSPDEEHDQVVCARVLNTSRMVAEYTRKFYSTADVKWRELTADDSARIRELAAWKNLIVMPGPI
jgi:starch phosphorylase